MYRLVKTIVSTALLVGIAGVATPAMAQRDGDERCTPDGIVEKYIKYTDSWLMQPLRKCGRASSGDNSYNGSNRDRRYDDEIEERSSRGRDTDGRRSVALPIDGDEKCGPDGFVLKFRKSSYSDGRWLETSRRCRN